MASYTNFSKASLRGDGRALLNLLNKKIPVSVIVMIKEKQDEHKKK